MKFIAFVAAALSVCLPAFAQLPAPNAAGISMGHLHFTAKDKAAQTKFWVEVMGAKPAKLGTLDVLLIPGTLLIVNQGNPTGGTVGSTVHHVGFTVPDLKAMLAKAEAAGVTIVSRNDQQAMLQGPDEIRIELSLDATSTVPFRNHHIHFSTADLEATRQWYVQTFSAVSGKRGKFGAADLPSVNLSFSEATPAPAGTKGRSLDHIGFEVKDLEAFTKKLEATGVHFAVPYRKVPALGISIAFFDRSVGHVHRADRGSFGSALAL